METPLEKMQWLMNSREMFDLGDVMRAVLTQAIRQYAATSEFRKVETYDA